ncbi:putative fungal-specific transcription factor [Aspergillus pseudoustus]|uniref:Fungal-specific transcription factor n=1 Tax=Aspergillus pseudoustus TaxID=1810923 RepID=A0ABR4II98_9EURO
MMSENSTAASRLVPIAPAPKSNGPEEQEPDADATKPFNCQLCVRKKIKCDRTYPACSSCRKAKVQCVYQAPLPRKRKRPPLENVYDRLARYERILKENNLLSRETADVSTGTGNETPFHTAASSPAADVQPVSKSRYIDNVLLLNDGEGDLCEVPDPAQETDGHDFEAHPLSSLMAYAVSGTISGSTHSLLEYHPSHEEAMKLWSAYVQNVEPLCKLIHIPTIANTVNAVSRQPTTASKSDECLVFVIYYFAVFSMSDSECLQDLNQSREPLMSKYRYAVCQALINAAWLKSASIQILQAYTLFLIALRTQVDPNTFWILTGIAVRLAQRIGLQRDGEASGLSSFEVQMRRRLFWQLLPLDSFASQVSGIGISMPPDAWDTKRPLNINDSQLFPGTSTQPGEHKGATEMIFCLSRLEIHNFYTRASVKSNGGGTVQFKDAEEIERMIDQVEDDLERRFIRYCDILNPLHFLTSGMVRSATNAVRLRARMPLLLKETTTLAERKDLCTLAEKILDTHTAIYSNPSLKKFQWHTQTFFIWDALICILRCLTVPGVYLPSELDAAWNKVAGVYSNHGDLAEGRRTLHITIGYLTIKAWVANPPSNSTPEPGYISSLRAQRGPGANRQQDLNTTATINTALDSGSIYDDFLAFDGMDLHTGTEIDFSSLDWMSLDQLPSGGDCA